MTWHGAGRRFVPGEKCTMIHSTTVASVERLGAMAVDGG